MDSKTSSGACQLCKTSSLPSVSSSAIVTFCTHQMDGVCISLCTVAGTTVAHSPTWLVGLWVGIGHSPCPLWECDAHRPRMHLDLTEGARLCQKEAGLPLRNGVSACLGSSYICMLHSLSRVSKWKPRHPKENVGANTSIFQISQCGSL